MRGQIKLSMLFGGFLLKRAHARGPRPCRPGADQHLTFLARSLWGKESFLYPSLQRRIVVVLRRQARACDLKIKWVRFESNRIHVVVKTPGPKKLANFLRATSGLIARKALGAEKGSPAKQKKGIRFWVRRPLSACLAKNQFWGESWTDELESFVFGSVGVAGTVGASGLAPPLAGWT